MTDERRRVGLDSLRPAAELYGDVVTAYVDVSRTSETGAQEVETRINNLTRDLDAAGIDESTASAVTERVARPTGHGGDASRVVVARQGEVATDLVVGDGVADHHHVGPVAHLLQRDEAELREAYLPVVRELVAEGFLTTRDSPV